MSHCDRAYCSGSGCIKCEDGFYLDQTNCYQCPAYCPQCSSSSTCTRCVTGRYGTTCEYTCRSPCTACISSTQCTECIPGHHGSACEKYCPLGCENILCDKDSGICTEGCRRGYYTNEENCTECPNQCSKCDNSSYCTDCNAGRYGFTCQRYCPAGCKDQLCHLVSGHCTEGCSDGYLFNMGHCIPGKHSKTQVLLTRTNALHIE